MFIRSFAEGLPSQFDRTNAPTAQQACADVFRAAIAARVEAALTYELHDLFNLPLLHPPAARHIVYADTRRNTAPPHTPVELDPTRACTDSAWAAYTAKTLAIYAGNTEYTLAKNRDGSPARSLVIDMVVGTVIRAGILMQRSPELTSTNPHMGEGFTAMAKLIGVPVHEWNAPLIAIAGYRALSEGALDINILLACIPVVEPVGGDVFCANIDGHLHYLGEEAYYPTIRHLARRILAVVMGAVTYTRARDTLRIDANTEVVPCDTPQLVGEYGKPGTEADVLRARALCHISGTYDATRMVSLDVAPTKCLLDEVIAADPWVYRQKNGQRWDNVYVCQDSIGSLRPVSALIDNLNNDQTRYGRWWIWGTNVRRRGGQVKAAVVTERRDPIAEMSKTIAMARAAGAGVAEFRTVVHAVSPQVTMGVAMGEPLVLDVYAGDAYAEGVDVVDDLMYEAYRAKAAASKGVATPPINRLFDYGIEGICIGGETPPATRPDDYPPASSAERTEYDGFCFAMCAASALGRRGNHRELTRSDLVDCKWSEVTARRAMQAALTPEEKANHALWDRVLWDIGWVSGVRGMVPRPVGTVLQEVVVVAHLDKTTSPTEVAAACAATLKRLAVAPWARRCIAAPGLMFVKGIK